MDAECYTKDQPIIECNTVSINPGSSYSCDSSIWKVYSNYKYMETSYAIVVTLSPIYMETRHKLRCISLGYVNPQVSSTSDNDIAITTL